MVWSSEVAGSWQQDCPFAMSSMGLQPLAVPNTKSTADAPSRVCTSLQPAPPPLYLEGRRHRADEPQLTERYQFWPQRGATSIRDSVSTRRRSVGARRRTIASHCAAAAVRQPPSRRVGCS